MALGRFIAEAIIEGQGSTELVTGAGGVILIFLLSPNISLVLSLFLETAL